MAKATLMLNEQWLSEDAQPEGSGFSRYRGMCYGVTRNGNCPNNPSDYTVGPAKLTLCRRHKRMWDDEYTRLRDVIISEHEAGLHGEGDDRKPFAELHTRGEYWHLKCRQCTDELASEELGVKPEHVAAAQDITRSMKGAQERLDKAVSRFNEAAKANGLGYAIRNYGDAVMEAEWHHSRWARVTNVMTNGNMDVVEATKRVREEVVNELIHDMVSDASRHAASRWVIDTDYFREVRP